MNNREAHYYLEELQRMMTQHRGIFSEEFVCANGMAIQALEQERKTGKWEHPNRCSECGFGVLLSPYMHNLDTGEYTLLYKFCPNCGAKMEVEEQKDESTSE